MWGNILIHSAGTPFALAGCHVVTDSLPDYVKYIWIQGYVYVCVCMYVQWWLRESVCVYVCVCNLLFKQHNHILFLLPNCFEDHRVLPTLWSVRLGRSGPGWAMSPPHKGQVCFLLWICWSCYKSFLSHHLTATVSSSPLNSAPSPGFFS